MGQDIHIHLQDGGRPLGDRVPVLRDLFLFGLMGVGRDHGAHPERHRLRGLPRVVCPEIAEALFTRAPSSSARRYRIDDAGRIVPDAQGELVVNRDWHSLTHMDATELERILAIWGSGIDYGLTKARPDGVGPDPEMAEVGDLLGLGPELEVPWFDAWRGIPGPSVSDPADLAHLVVWNVLPRHEFEGALATLRSSGAVLLRRYGHRPPVMGGSWQPRGEHPTLTPLVARMRELEAAGGRPEVVVFFDG